MARIRSIKPEFPQSESMGRVSRESRLCFMLLWTLSDDAGILRGNSRMLASLLYPYDDDAKDCIDGWMGELEREGCIGRYTADNDSYVQIVNWLKHQKIDKPSKSKFPPPPESSRILANPREGSSLDQGSRIKEGIKEPREDSPSDFQIYVMDQAGIPGSPLLAGKIAKAVEYLARDKKLPLKEAADWLIGVMQKFKSSPAFKDPRFNWLYWFSDARYDEPEEKWDAKQKSELGYLPTPDKYFSTPPKGGVN